MNVGKLLIGDKDGFAPCTPAGVLYMLQAMRREDRRRGVRDRRPQQHRRQADGGADDADAGVDATVTVCHSRTRDLGEHTRRADILIVAAGRPQIVTGDMVKPGAVVIDVGMNRIPDATKKSGTRLVGDVEFDERARGRVADHAGARRRRAR